MKRDARLVVDGDEALYLGRQSMPTFELGHRLNSRPFGTMGVGMPFAVDAKAACSDKKVICRYGDGSLRLDVRLLLDHEPRRLADPHRHAELLPLRNGEVD